MKILIVDDEKPARDRLRQIIDDIAGHIVVGEAENGEQAVALATDKKPDIVLLDIRMPGLNGIETAHHLNALEHPPAVVFTTAYDEHAIEAFEARAVGYVLKPVRRGRLANALDHAVRLAAATLHEIAVQSDIDPRRKHVCARSHGQLKLISIDDVYFFQADQKYVNVHHRQGRNLINDSLTSLEQEFATDFVRIHRGAVVAVDKIDQLINTPDGKTQIILRNYSQHEDKALIISRRHLAEVRSRIKGG